MSELQRASEEVQLVVFTIGGGEFAIPISLVREIIHISKLVVLPKMPESMVGIIDVRGAVLPVVDLGKRFALGEEQKKDYTTQKVLLVETGDSMVGYLVDAVSEVLQVSRRSLEPTAQIGVIGGAGLIHAICNLEGRLIPIVDIDKLVTTQEARQMQNSLSACY